MEIGKDVIRMKTKFPPIVTAVVELIVGILLLVNPVGFTTGIIFVLGLVLVVYGIYKILQYFRATPQEAALEKALTVGILAVLIGLWCVLRTDWFIELFPVLTSLYGVILLISGVVKIQWTTDKIRMGTGRWGVTALSAIFTLICAILILANPFASTNALWMFIGITLIVEAVIDIISAFMKRPGSENVIG